MIVNGNNCGFSKKLTMTAALFLPQTQWLGMAGLGALAKSVGQQTVDLRRDKSGLRIAGQVGKMPMDLPVEACGWQDLSVTHASRKGIAWTPSKSGIRGGPDRSVLTGCVQTLGFEVNCCDRGAVWVWPWAGWP